MKILLVFPQKDKQTGLFIKRAFEQLGCKVNVVDAKSEPGRMLSAAKKFQPDLLLCSRTPALFPDTKSVKTVSPKTKLACWNVDKRNHVSEFKQSLQQLWSSMDIIYTIAKGNVLQYKELFPNAHVLHLQQGCDPETHKIENITEEDKLKYECDVMFAGSLESCGGHYVRNQRTSLIRTVAKHFNFKRYGEKDNRIVDSEANKAHLCSKIVLGHNGWPDVEISMSVRDYKVMASGGFLLTQYCKGMENWFDIGKECVVYNSNEECVEKIQYYLNHPDERIEIANNGHKAVHSKHKYVDRIKELISHFNRIYDKPI